MTKSTVYIKESTFSPLVSQWITSSGYECYSEVRSGYLTIDHVGVRWADESIVCVELKTTMCDEVINQAKQNQFITPLSYAAIPKRRYKERTFDRVRSSGVGVLIDGIAVFEPRPRVSVIESKRLELLEVCRTMEPGGLGGVRYEKGDGPAIRCFKRIEEYRLLHPDASWEEVFENVPNHYAHPLSLAGGMWSVMETARKKREGQ